VAAEPWFNSRQKRIPAKTGTICGGLTYDDTGFS